ncbi:MAG: EamA family transporter [Candidatus Fimimonas sp.]
MWFVIALLGAVFTSLTTIFAKIGIKDVNSDFATAYRTLVVILCSLALCLISGSIYSLPQLSGTNWLFLSLSGIATGCSWLCYYKALKLGDVNKVAPIDKSSFILTSILFVIFFFDDTTNNGNPLTIGMLALSVVLIACGTFLMITKKQPSETKSRAWLLFAVLSAVFAAIVSLFVKMGLKGIPSDLGTFVRTLIVFVFATTIVLAKKEQVGVAQISKKSWVFLTISGVATGGAWLCEYAALGMEGVNPVAVSSVGKLSILLTMAFSALILKEKFGKKSLLGLALLTAGIVVIIVFSL